MKEEKFYLTNPDYDLLGEKLLTMPDFNSEDYDLSEEIKSKVYHCSNERLNAYFKDLNLKDARIATVGSSGDQVLNAIYYGAKDITLIDANIFTRAYFEYKTAMIKNLDFCEFKKHIGKFSMFNWQTYSKFSHDLSKRTKSFFDELMLNQYEGYDYDEGYLTDSAIRNRLFHTPCNDFDEKEENLFYNNEEDYNKLKKLLIEKNFELKILNAELKEFPSKLKGEFDYIFLSNIYEYVDKDLIISVIDKLYKKIKVGGAIQYHYQFSTPEYFYIESNSFDTSGNLLKTNENLIRKTAYAKQIKTIVPRLENDHYVYFIEKKENENSLELNI